MLQALQFRAFIRLDGFIPFPLQKFMTALVCRVPVSRDGKIIGQ